MSGAAVISQSKAWGRPMLSQPCPAPSVRLSARASFTFQAIQAVPRTQQACMASVKGHKRSAVQRRSAAGWAAGPGRRAAAAPHAAAARLVSLGCRPGAGGAGRRPILAGSLGAHIGSGMCCAAPPRPTRAAAPAPAAAAAAAALAAAGRE